MIPTPLERIERYAIAREEAKEDLAEATRDLLFAVEDARKEGRRWEVIEGAAGISRQAIHQLGQRFLDDGETEE